MRKAIVFVAAVLFVLVLVPCQQAKAADEPHYLWIPYCVYSGGWWTGMHVKTNYLNETITAGFSGNTFYASGVVVPLDSRGRWTGYVQGLLDNPESFQSPTLLHMYSVKGAFTVTQFVGNAEGGFGFQTFYSVPGTSASNAWPYMTPTP